MKKALALIAIAGGLLCSLGLHAGAGDSTFSIARIDSTEVSQCKNCKPITKPGGL